MELRQRIVTYLGSELGWTDAQTAPEWRVVRDAEISELLKQNFSDCEDLVADFLTHAIKDVRGQLPPGWHVSGMDYPEFGPDEMAALWKFVDWVEANL